MNFHMCESCMWGWFGRPYSTKWAVWYACNKYVVPEREKLHSIWNGTKMCAAGVSKSSLPNTVITHYYMLMFWFSLTQFTALLGAEQSCSLKMNRCYMQIGFDELRKRCTPVEVGSCWISCQFLCDGFIHVVRFLTPMLLCCLTHIWASVPKKTLRSYNDINLSGTVHYLFLFWNQLSAI